MHAGAQKDDVIAAAGPAGLAVKRLHRVRGETLPAEISYQGPSRSADSAFSQRRLCQCVTECEFLDSNCTLTNNGVLQGDKALWIRLHTSARSDV